VAELAENKPRQKPGQKKKPCFFGVLFFPGWVTRKRKPTDDAKKTGVVPGFFASGIEVSRLCWITSMELNKINNAKKAKVIDIVCDLGGWVGSLLFAL